MYSLEEKEALILNNFSRFITPEGVVLHKVSENAAAPQEVMNLGDILIYGNGGCLLALCLAQYNEPDNNYMPLIRDLIAGAMLLCPEGHPHRTYSFTVTEGMMNEMEKWYQYKENNLWYRHDTSMSQFGGLVGGLAAAWFLLKIVEAKELLISILKVFFKNKRRITTLKGKVTEHGNPVCVGSDALMKYVFAQVYELLTGIRIRKSLGWWTHRVVLWTIKTLGWLSIKDINLAFLGFFILYFIGKDKHDERMELWDDVKKTDKRNIFFAIVSSHIDQVDVKGVLERLDINTESDYLWKDPKEEQHRVLKYQLNNRVNDWFLAKQAYTFMTGVDLV